MHGLVDGFGQTTVGHPQLPVMPAMSYAAGHDHPFGGVVGGAPKPVAVLTARDLRHGPRLPTGDEQLNRLLVRNVFVEDREDRMVPQIMDQLVALVWLHDRYVPAVIAHERYTPLAEMEQLHRKVPWVLFNGSMEELARFSGMARSVRGRPVIPQSNIAWLLRHRRWRRRMKRLG